MAGKHFIVVMRDTHLYLVGPFASQKMAGEWGSKDGPIRRSALADHNARDGRRRIVVRHRRDFSRSPHGPLT